MVLKPEKVDKYYYLTYPKIATVITSGTFEEPNAMAASWTTPVSFDPMLFVVAISPKRYSHGLIKKFMEFGVNILPYEKYDLCYKVGYYSGREFNKFEKFSLTKIKAKKIRPPLIGESISAFECKVVNIFSTGDHDLFVGKVVETWIDPEYVHKSGKIRLEKISPVFHVGGDEFSAINPEKIVRGVK